MLLCVLPHTALPLLVAVGRKPPWNQPQVIPLPFSRSPTFWPDIVTVSRLEQSSNVGWGSPMTVSVVGAIALEGGLLVGVAPWVRPETRFRAPGVDGPKTLLKELSFIAKRCP